MKLGSDEKVGSDLEQVIAMLERSEIDYVYQYDSDDAEDGLNLDELGSYVDANDTVRMSFDEEGNLIEINPITN